MPAAFTLRMPLGGFEREPRSYDDLRRLAARCAKDELAGRTLCNHATQLAITLSPAALAAATRPGAPSALLLAIPDLPALLSHALYVRTVADPRRRPDIRRVHLLAARAEIAGRPVELLFAIRETFGGQCFLDRVSERGASTRKRQDGGSAPNDRDTDPSVARQTADAPEQLAQVPATTVHDMTRVIFGETAGLYPHSIDPDRSPYDPANWDTDSADNLAAARQYIGIVAGRNGQTHSADADLSNPIETRAWADAANAAAKAHANPDLLDEHIDHFYLRGNGDTRNPWPTLTRYLRIGPFRNVGGGDAGRGNDLYIEFYGRR
ncbi:MAG TPA: hypothetical protein VEI03_14120 [Stellaceae bacterium]|nr:hypothetical protein [Stellaceae bacterium]